MSENNQTQETTQAVGTAAPQQINVHVTVKNRNNNVFAVILVLLGIGVGYWFWSTLQPSPAATVERFFTAFNEKDMNAVVECLDPKYERLYGAVNSLIGNFFGLSIKDMAALFPFIYEIALQDSSNKDIEDLQIDAKVISTKVDGDLAVVTVHAAVKDRRTGKVKDAGEGTVRLRKFGDDGWRIIDLK